MAWATPQLIRITCSSREERSASSVASAASVSSSAVRLERWARESGAEVSTASRWDVVAAVLGFGMGGPSPRAMVVSPTASARGCARTRFVPYSSGAEVQRCVHGRTWTPVVLLDRADPEAVEDVRGRALAVLGCLLLTRPAPPTNPPARDGSRRCFPGSADGYRGSTARATDPRGRQP